MCVRLSRFLLSHKFPFSCSYLIQGRKWLPKTGGASSNAVLMWRTAPARRNNLFCKNLWGAIAPPLSPCQLRPCCIHSYFEYLHCNPSQNRTGIKDGKVDIKISLFSNHGRNISWTEKNMDWLLGKPSLITNWICLFFYFLRWMAASKYCCQCCLFVENFCIVLFKHANIVVPRSCAATPRYSIFEATPFWIGFKKLKLNYLFFEFPKNKTIDFFSVHFIANLTTNPNDNSSQLSFDVYYVSVALKLTILE